jgi:pyruvate ferredoxin oxidoreductase alpha subunit
VENYRCDDAEYVIVTIGSVSGLVRSVVDELRKEGVAAGLLKIRYMRPLPDAEVVKALRGVKAAGVLEKDISFGYEGTVFTNVNSALQAAALSVRTSNFIGGLGGADISREQIREIFRSLKSDGRRVNFLGINRDEYDD